MSTKQELPAILDDDALPFVDANEQGEDSPAAKASANDVTLATLGQSLLSKFRDVELKRTYIEDRWLEDLRQYHGMYDPAVLTELIDAETCSLFLNITKPKTHAFSARVMDMALPTDDKNWGLEPSPVPEIAGLDTKDEKVAMAALGTGDGTPTPAPSVGAQDPTDAQSPNPAAQPGGVAQQPGAQPSSGTTVPDSGTEGAQAPQPIITTENNVMFEKDIVAGVQDEMAERCRRMEDEIDDQLTEAKYNGAQRKAIEQMAKLGAGFVMGPVILSETRVTWKPVARTDDPSKYNWIRTLVPNADKRAGVQYVDCWNLYPDMSGSDPAEWDFFFVQYLLTAGQFRRYAKKFNWIQSQCDKIAAGGVSFNVRTLRWMNELKLMSETMNIVDNRHRVLRYYGEVSKEDLRASGMPVDEMDLEGTVTGTVWMCDGVVLKMDLNPLDSGENPISACYCDKDEASPFGQGIPRLMRGEQESVNAAWRMKHDNAGLSVCPQTVIKINSVTPSDGDLHLKPKKVWYVADDVQRVADVFATFNIDSHQEELDNILQQGIKFADDVTQLPIIMQGDTAPNITQTATGMSILYNASTVVLRRTIKFYDDHMAEPTIDRFYQWNMQFNPRDDIKGDFRPVAKGSSTLLDKEQQGQALDTMMQLAMQPTWQPYIDMEKLLREALKTKRIADIILPSDKIKQNLAAQAAAAQAEAQAKNQSGQNSAAVTPDPLAQQKLDAQKDATQARREQTQANVQIAQERIASEEKIAGINASKTVATTKIQQSGENQRLGATHGHNERIAATANAPIQ